MTGGRRKARSIALQALYEIDSVQHDPDEILTHLQAEADLSEENFSFARELVEGVLRYKDKLDAQIQRYAPAWAYRTNRFYRPEYLTTCNLRDFD